MIFIRCSIRRRLFKRCGWNYNGNIWMDKIDGEEYRIEKKKWHNDNKAALMVNKSPFLKRKNDKGPSL